MKTLLIIIIYLVPFLAIGQNDVNTDTREYGLTKYHYEYPEQLGMPNLDSLSFEIRVWISGHYVSSLFIKINKSQQEKWNYSRGFVDHAKNKAIVLPTMQKSPDLDSLWQIMEKNNILTLPDQKYSSISLVKDGVEYEYGQEDKEKLIDMPRGEHYIIETFTPDGYRQYGYYAPDALHKMCLRSNLKCEEHRMMNNIVSVINQNFEIRDLGVAQLKSTMKKNRKNDR